MLASGRRVEESLEFARGRDRSCGLLRGRRRESPRARRRAPLFGGGARECRAVRLSRTATGVVVCGSRDVVIVCL